MGTFFRAIIALIAAIFLGLGALLLVGFGVCTLLLMVGGDTASFGVGAVVGIIAALAFGVRVFISVFKASKRTSHSSQRALRSSDKKPVPPHYYRDRAQRRKQREQENNDNAD